METASTVVLQGLVCLAGQLSQALHTPRAIFALTGVSRVWHSSWVTVGLAAALAGSAVAPALKFVAGALNQPEGEYSLD